MRLAEARNVPHISTGDIFREHINAGTPLGRKVKEHIDQGHLAPDDLACAIVADRLDKPDCEHGYILDGFPRSLGQAEQLEALLQQRGERLDAVISLEVEDNEIVSRLSARRTCPVCKAIYNLRFNPPRMDERCDNPACGGAALVQRDDDTEATVRERLRVYHAESEPILQFYERNGQLRRVSGMGSHPDAIFATIECLVDSAAAACAPTQSP
jgi:adenylate kinase